MQSQLCNIERIREEINAEYQKMQHFVTESIRNGRSIIDQDSQEVSSLLPKKKLIRKWLAWQHQVALNFLRSSSILKEKLRCFDDLPLLSAGDIKERLIFKRYKEMTEEQMIERLYDRRIIRQRDINFSYLRA